MGETVDESGDRETGEQPLSERVLDLFVFLPTGIAVTVAEELPRLAERGRERFGVQVNSARAVGKFAVVAGQQELKRRSENLRRTGAGGTGSGPAGATGTTTPPTTGPSRLRTIPYPPERTGPTASVPTVPQAAGPVDSGSSAPDTATPAATAPRVVDAHVPDVATLAIPGFDTLSASQVVQRLDGLRRAELVAVRTYETSTRGRRTVLSRVDQLLDERS